MTYNDQRLPFLGGYAIYDITGPRNSETKFLYFSNIKLKNNNMLTNHCLYVIRDIS
jgi:hypothetical protein